MSEDTSPHAHQLSVQEPVHIRLQDHFKPNRVLPHFIHDNRNKEALVEQNANKIYPLPTQHLL